MGFLCSVDTGGTFTDCVVQSADGTVHEAKAPSTPDDYSRGVLDSLSVAAGRFSLSLPELLERTTYVLVGTTVGTNAVLTGESARVGMLVTRGHADALRIMRGHGRVAGLPLSDALVPARTDKPEPLVDPALCVEIDERVDCTGGVVVPLRDEQVEAAVLDLRERGVDSIAIGFLWCFLNPDHERRAREIAARVHPEAFLSTSHEIAPRWGEYERWSAAALNARLGPLTAGFVDGVERHLRELDYRGQLLLMTCNGGALPAEEAKRQPLLLLGSGPTGGIVGCSALAERLGDREVLCTDMGGTSFDVGMLTGGDCVRGSTRVVGRYEHYVPNVDVKSVGSGGGSIGWREPLTGRLRVGPRSAGSTPGPACYGRGGDEPTVTDANVVLGLIDPEFFLGGTMRLDLDAAHRVVDRLAGELGMDREATANGIVRIADAAMADLLRKATVEKGLHPEDFVVYSYGGAGGLHASAISRELGARRIVVPLSRLASVWSAFGVGSSDVMHIHEAMEIRSAPFDVAAVNATLDSLEGEAVVRLEAAGRPRDAIALRRFASLRYSLQVHELTVELPAGTLDEGHMEAAIAAFERQYEARYGRGSGYSEAGFELVGLTVEAVGRLQKPPLAPQATAGAAAPAGSTRTRDVFWHELGERVATPAFRQEDLSAGGPPVHGPAVVDLPTTTVAVRPGDVCSLDAHGSLVIEVTPDD